MESFLTAFCEKMFFPILHPIFAPTNTFLSKFYQPYATICAIGFFIGAMIWVGVVLHEPYVNRGRAVRSIWTDLRLWTVLSMLPHVFVYFYFY
ncbi:MAG TPA: hypothetical protein PKI11_17075 [Candidatus Hydrogenedentes bacterium]|nr:hypothetical protein [Candidatus Hydrogenedentota bacterium]HNT86992.1 hypothetical protein [Candidatus Hydrogenedentota bacterium]